MKKKLLNVFYYILYNLYIFDFFYWINRNNTQTLTYHNVIPDDWFDDSVHLGVSHSESVFECHIQLINNRFRQKNILITFDDGYKNQCEIVPKILEKYGLRGVFFITFKLIIDGLSLSVDKVTQWVSYVPAGDYHVAGMKLIISSENRHEIASLVYEKLLLNYKLWDSIENELNSIYAFNALKINPELRRLRFQPMTSQDLLKLISSGHIVAAHSWDHRPLSILPIKEQEQDFLLSKTYSDKYCNSKLYSYPYGGKEEVSPDTIQLCKKYGFEAAYVNDIFTHWPKEDSCFQLARMSLPNHCNIYILDAKLSGFEFFIKSFIRKILGIMDFLWKKKVTLNGFCVGFMKK